MNEQNNSNQTPQQGSNGVIAPTNINNAPAAQAQTSAPTPQPVAATQPAVQQAAPAIEPLPVPNVVQQPQPIAQQPVQQTQVTVQPQAVAQQTPVQSAPAPVQVQPAPQVQPVQAVPQATPVQTVTPVPVTTESVPAAQAQAAAPAPQPVQEEEVIPANPVYEPIQPVEVKQSEFSQPAEFSQPVQPTEFSPQQPQAGVYGPSIPINSGMDATEVGFVPASSSMPKKKNKPLIAAIVIVIIAVVGSLGYFVGYPFVMKTFFNDPKNVYEITINELYKGISSTALDIVHSKAIYDVDVTIDSNLENVKAFSGYTYNVNFGVDPKKKLLQAGLKMTDNENKNEYSVFQYIKDGKEYLKYSNNRGYIYNGEVDFEEENQIFGSYEKLFERTGNLDSEDIQYLANKLSELTNNSIKKEYLSKEDTTLVINGETTKVTNNKYEVDTKVLGEMIKGILDGLKNDSKSLKIIAKYLDKSEDDTKEVIDSLIEMATDNDEKITYTFNIYTFGKKNEIIGFGLTTSDQSIELQYYKKDNYFELDGKTSIYNEETGKNDEQTLLIVGKGDGSKTSVSIKYNDSEVLSLVVTAWEENKKEFSYNFKIENVKINGKVSAVTDLNDDRLRFTVTGDLNTSDEYIKVTAVFTEDWTNDVANINTDNAVTLSDAEFEAKKKEFMALLMETPAGILLSTVGGEYSDSIGDYYNNNYSYGGGDSSNKDEQPDVPVVVETPTAE